MTISIFYVLQASEILRSMPLRTSTRPIRINVDLTRYIYLGYNYVPMYVCVGGYIVGV